MSEDKPLSGKRIAILVEHKFIEEEIKAYQTRFPELGANIDFVSRIWWGVSRPAIATLYSDVDPSDPNPKRAPGELEVTKDISRVDLSQYDAIISSANYTSVRLRWSRHVWEGPQPLDARAFVQEPQAVELFADAMKRPGLVKGALCHGLWILTPHPELLRRRRVICIPVVMADVLNCGAEITVTDNRVVVDDDLVTGYSKNEVGPFIDAIAKQITTVSQRKEPAMTQPVAEPKASGRRDGHRRILVLLSEYGYWGEELVGPLSAFAEAEKASGVKYEPVFMTPGGKRPIAIPVSMDPGYVDPPLGRSVTTGAMAQEVQAIDDPSNPRLDRPENLSDRKWFPMQPYWSADDVLRKWEDYYRDVEKAAERIADFDALLIVGGSGPLIDLANNHRVHELILAFVRAGKPVAAECYGVACLAFARDLGDRKSIIWGKHVTGHCKEYDYLDGTGVVKGRNREGKAEFYDLNMGPPPYPLEYILRDATGPDGGYHGNVGKATSVIVDFPFITGRSTPDSYLTGAKLVEVLDQGLKRFGW